MHSYRRKKILCEQTEKYLSIKLEPLQTFFYWVSFRIYLNYTYTQATRINGFNLSNVSAISRELPKEVIFSYY